MNERERWAREIRAARLRMKIKQVQLAAILHVRQQDVSAWENARREPSDAQKLELIRRLSIDPKLVAPDWVRPLLKAAA